MQYFDHNASSPLIGAGKEAWLEAVGKYVGNASSPHRLGARAEKALGEARERLGEWLGCRAEEIIWTSGATESNNTVVKHWAEASEGEAWVSGVEHPCVLAGVRRYFKGRSRLLSVNPDGVIELEGLREQMEQRKPAFIGVMAANNETGVLQPWAELVELCRQSGVPFFCDAAQWLGKLPAEGLGACDFVSGCGHKFGGPQGVGFLKCPPDLRPLLVGGPQEDGRRAGTENVAGVLAMIAALADRQKHWPEIGERKRWRSDFEERLREALPGVQILGTKVERLWNTVSAVMPSVDCRQRWVVKLDKLGFAVSTGSACASGKEEFSHVLGAMGLGAEAAGRVLRFSSSWETPEEDWGQLLEGIKQGWTELQG